MPNPNDTNEEIIEDDFMPPMDWEDSSLDEENDWMMPSMDDEEIKEEKETPSEPKEDNKENEDKSNPNPDQDEEDNLDLQALLWDLDKIDESLEESGAILDKGANMTPEDIETLKSQNEMYSKTVESLQNKIVEIMKDKTDLIYKNAELTAFGWDFSDPQLLIISRNFSKAKSWDDIAKNRVLETIKTMYEDMTGKSIDATIVDKNSDVMSAVEQYNSSVNPKIKDSSSEDDGFSM